MKIASVRKIIEIFALERENCLLSKAFCDQLTALFDALNEDDEVNLALINSISSVITAFWHQALEGNAPYSVINPWLELGDALKEVGCLLPNPHHPYFYRRWQLDYDKNGDGKILAEQFLPIIMSCCRMIGYVNERDLQGYPLPYLENKISRAKQLKFRHLEESCEGFVTSLSVIFYILNHHCSKKQQEILQNLIHYRAFTTSEERRSESALLTTLIDNPGDVLNFLLENKDYVEGRVLLNNSLKTLKGLIPESRAELIAKTTGKCWYYKIIHSINTIAPRHLVEIFSKILTESFASQKARTYPDALAFADHVIQASEDFSPFVGDSILSAAYVFCLQQYINLRKAEPAAESMWEFSSATKCNAARKLLKEETGTPSGLSPKEFFASNQGRLKDLKKKFEDYKEVRAGTSEWVWEIVARQL